MIFINTENCCGCYACYNACPVGAIEMKTDKEGFSYPKISKKKCIDCGLCDEVCPTNEKPLDDKGNERFYGARTTDDELRNRSSSGGIFSLLATSVLNDNGVVFGASMMEDGSVKHTYVESIENLDTIRRTKYVQSEIGECFKEVKNFLEDGRSVLFIGTPCQVRGLQKYLDKAYDKLLLVDLICYGVPSPGVWKKYLSYLKKTYGDIPEFFSFRDKRNHDHGHTVACTISGKEHCWNINDDLYCKKYFRNEIIRPSCHKCNFCTPVRSSDITIGDFWGLENCNPDFDDKMGTSLVITHSDKGENAFNNILDSVKYFECTRDEATQPRLCSPTEPSYRRDREMMFFRVLPFSVWLKKRW